MALSRGVKCVGTLSATEVDDFGNPLELIFVDERGNEYAISHGDLWQDLSLYLDEDMWISAQIVDNSGDIPVIDVDSYRVFDELGDGQATVEKHQLSRKHKWDDDY